ncbi:MAG: hypothetical protein ABSH51_32460, partial [Solirubrobacteraceae bacterium]
EGTIERVAVEHLELAPNPRTHIPPDSITILAGLLMRTGQLIPCIGHRPNPVNTAVVLYDGQRRLLAAQASHQLAGTDDYQGLAPVRSLIVLLLDHEPAADEVRRIQAQANQREELSLADQQTQFADCWAARAGLHDDDRIAAVCADLGITPKRAHNLRRQLTLPEPIRHRVSERPAGGQISVTMANRLADMHQIAPELTDAVANRITTTDLHDKALRDLGAFVHRTLVEDEHPYAVRIDDGAMLDAVHHIEHARAHLTPGQREQLARILACDPGKLDSELDTLTARAKTTALKIAITAEARDRARAGQFAYVHERGQDFADTIWVVNPAFIIDLIHDHLANHHDDQPAHDEAFFAGAALHDDELRAAGEEDRARRDAQRRRHAEATASNLGLGHDLRAGLMDPTPGQLHALRAIICHLLARHHPDVIAYGAGWTDQDRQHPVGDTGRHQPRQPDTILHAELQRALADPDPLRGIAQLTASWAAAFVLDPDAVTRTKTLGTERVHRKLTDALPGGPNPLRAAVWGFLRPMLSPRLAALHRDTFVLDEPLETTVQLAAHRAESDLADLDLGDDPDVAAA